MELRIEITAEEVTKTLEVGEIDCETVESCLAEFFGADEPGGLPVLGELGGFEPAEPEIDFDELHEYGASFQSETGDWVYPRKQRSVAAVLVDELVENRLFTSGNNDKLTDLINQRINLTLTYAYRKGFEDGSNSCNS